MTLIITGILSFIAGVAFSAWYMTNWIDKRSGKKNRMDTKVRMELWEENERLKKELNETSRS